MTKRKPSKITICGAVLLLALLGVSMIGCGGKQSLSNLSAREMFDLGKGDDQVVLPAKSAKGGDPAYNQQHCRQKHKNFLEHDKFP